MQTNATFSVVISTKNCLGAPKLATVSSLKFPCCRLVTNEQYQRDATSSRVMNHVIAANQPLHWLRLLYDITSEKSRILFVQPAMSKNRAILSFDQRIETVLCRLGEAHHRGGSGAGSLGGAQQVTVGRGVVAEIFRELQKPARFSGGGGGGSSRIFSYPISRNRPDSLAGERSLPHIRSSPAIFMNR